MGQMQQGVKSEGEVKRIIKSVEHMPSGTKAATGAPLTTRKSGKGTKKL